jgi:hypothetical protein
LNITYPIAKAFWTFSNLFNTFQTFLDLFNTQPANKSNPKPKKQFEKSFAKTHEESFLPIPSHNSATKKIQNLTQLVLN